MNGVVIRRADVGDLPALLQVMAQVPETPQWSRAMWNGVFAPNGVSRGVEVATNGTTLVGFEVTAFYDDFAELESIAVLAESRGQGIGGRLLAAAIRAAEVHGASSLQLEVSAMNFAAGALYASAGFTTEGRRPRYYWHGAMPAEALLMRRMLR